jgi:pyruvate kinase
MRNTKIIATIGPGSQDPETVRKLLMAGVDVFRVNASHGTHGEHSARIRTIRTVAAAHQFNPAILLDLQGPKIRLGQFAGGSATLATDSTFTITTEPVLGTAALASTTYFLFAKEVLPGSKVLLADGAVELRAISSNGVEVQFEVVSGGTVKDRQGINLPGVRVSIPSMTEKDFADLDFGLQQEVDLVALSFVRSAGDVMMLRERMREGERHVPIISKIEKPEALDHLEEIIDASDGVMVARGDLGVELALPRVPAAQKRIIERARFAGKFVITATQMFESMIQNSSPTRAEVNDVANAIFDGTDATMLSAETATGKHPVEAVRMMSEVALEAENWLRTRTFPDPPPFEDPSHAQMVAEAAHRAGLSAGVKAIVVFTASGYTARLISRFRPHVPIYAICESAAVARSLAPVYGVHTIAPVRVETIEEMVQVSDLKLLGEAWSRIGDSVILVAGGPTNAPGASNLIKLHRIGAVNVQSGVE